MTDTPPLIRPLRLGPLELANNLSLAPMHKRTHLGFRLLARRQGAGLAHTEMAAPEDLLGANGVRKGLNIMASTPEDRPLGVQLIPRDISTLIDAVVLVAAQGTAALIDLNFACPSRRVAGNGRGAAMLRHPDRAAKFVEAACGASALPVTVKMRHGFTDSPKDREWAWETARAVVAAGAVGITLHARSAEQQYHGRADWSIIRRWAEELPVPVFGSGDLRSPQAVIDMLRETRCSGASIARGAVGAPWIFRQIIELDTTGSFEPVTPMERARTITEHYEGLLVQYGPSVSTRMISQVGLMYTAGLPGAAEARRALQCVTTDERFRSVVAKYFGPMG